MTSEAFTGQVRITKDSDAIVRLEVWHPTEGTVVYRYYDFTFAGWDEYAAQLYAAQPDILD